MGVAFHEAVRLTPPACFEKQENWEKTRCRNAIALVVIAYERCQRAVSKPARA
jgi:hypothetical protein